MNDRRRRTGFFGFLATFAAGSMLLATAGCGDDASGAGGGGGGGGGSDAPEATVEVERGAAGVFLGEVAVYQGVRRSIMRGGALAPSDVPLVAGRPAVVRAFYAINRDYDRGEVTARLTWGDGEAMEVTRRLAIGSIEGDLATTFVFQIPAERMVAGPLDVKVELVQKRQVPAAEADVAEPASPARWSSTGELEIGGDGEPLKVVLVPFQYDADGSSRLPDTSATNVESYRSTLQKLYPVSDVDITVREAVPWSGSVDPAGDGWGELLDATYDLRRRDAPADDVYYYGIFNPADDFYGYCRQGCVLGLTYLNDRPSSTGSVDLQMAIGVGYPQAGPDTAAHEIGHSMGRAHAPCGGPQGVDPAFPYAGGTIGVHGIEPDTLVMHSPAETDMMGYCEHTWVSDYTWTALFDRMQGTGLFSRSAPVEPVQAMRIRVDGDGNVTARGTTQFDPRSAPGRAVTTSLTRIGGARIDVDARVLELDHLPGATILVPGVDGSVRRLDLVVDGRPITLTL